jgi:CHASE2 domain-containing sensor protein
MKQVRFWGGFLAACALLVVFDHAQGVAAGALEAGAVYQRLVTSGFRTPYARDIAVVLIRNGTEPMEVTLVNVCEQRQFLSRVLQLLKGASPDVIVIDKYFAPDACRTQPQGTIALQTAVQKLLDAGISVVVGHRADQHGNIAPTLPLADGKADFFEGDLTLEQDVRRVVFEWQNATFPDGSTRASPTLAFQAALAKTPELRRVNRRLEAFYSRREQPYAAFLPQSAVDEYTFSGIKLLCGEAANENTDWRNCSTPQEAWLKRLRGKVVVLGEDTLGGLRGKVVVLGEDTLGVDQHVTVVGTIAGVLLQANYIEAILNDDLFQPLPTWVGLLYSFVLFALIQWVVINGRSGLKLALAAIVVVGAYGLSWAVIELFGFYLNPGVGLVAAILSWIADRATGNLMTRRDHGNSINEVSAT